MVIVKTKEELQRIIMRAMDEPPLIFPLMEDHRLHYSVSKPSIYFIGWADARYCVPVRHSESTLTDLVERAFTQIPQFFSPDGRLGGFLGSQAVIWDVRGLEYESTGAVTEFSSFFDRHINHYYDIYDIQARLHNTIPLGNWISVVNRYFDHLLPWCKIPTSTYSHKFNTLLIPTIAEIESSGLHVDTTRITFPKLKSTIRNDCLYSQYNPFTTTGRPSCTFNGVNFLALNKTDGSRSVYTSRFNRGRMVLIDFESFHIRLISQLMKYTLPTHSIHEYLGQQYFHTDSLTPDQYEDSKRRTFKLLYGEARDINAPDFFQHVYQYIDQLWSDYQWNNAVISPRWQHKLTIEDPSRAKVFNYLVQMEETERNFEMMSLLLHTMKQANYSSKVVLYTYDSLLLDYNLDDGDILTHLMPVITSSNIYPVRIYYGTSYHDMKKLTF